MSADKIEKLIFIKLPVKDGKELEEFKDMIGHTYHAYLSEYCQEYIIFKGITEEGEKACKDSIYKRLLAIGENEEFAKAVAYEENNNKMCLYFPKECFRDRSINFNKVHNIVEIYKNEDDDFIDMQELQAINQKCKELGWI